MSKRYPVSRWVLPDDVAPDTSICYQVPVPNDPQHIAAFKGAIYMLAKAYSWQNDDAHTALDVAAVWLDIFNNLETCEMVRIRIKPTDPCIIQLSNDGGSTWEDQADVSQCATERAQQVLQDALDDGQISGGGQQPGQGAGEPGVCYEYTITLRGNDRWHAPVALEGGDVITVDTVSGAWWDGDITHTWRCPNGQSFLLGACTGGTITDGGDPEPTLPHMELIGNLPEDGTTPYFDMNETEYEVPSGVAPGEFYLQANDGTLEDNQGSVNFHVKICKSLWTHIFDFTVNDGGFAVRNPVYSCHYVAGVGWQTTSTEPGIDIYIDLPSGDYGIIKIEMEAIWSKAGGDYGAGLSYYQNSPLVVYLDNGGIPADGAFHMQATGTGPAQKRFVVAAIPGHTGTATITSAKITGTGISPY